MSTHNIGLGPTHSNVTSTQPITQPQRKLKRAAFDSEDQPEVKRRKVDSEGRTYNLPTVQSSYDVNQFSDDFAKVAQQTIQEFAGTPAPENKWDFQLCVPPAATSTPIVAESNSSSATSLPSPRMASESRLSGGTMTQDFYNDGIMQGHPDEKNGITGDGLLGNTLAESKLKLQLAALAKFQMKQRQEELKEAEEKQAQSQSASSLKDSLTFNEEPDEDRIKEESDEDDFLCTLPDIGELSLSDY